MAPNPTKRRKWNPRVAVQVAEAALRHAEVVRKFQFGQGGLGFGSSKPVWNKTERRKLVVEHE